MIELLFKTSIRSKAKPKVNPKAMLKKVMFFA